MIALFFSLNNIEGNKSLSCEDQGNKSVGVGLAMTMSAKVWMLYLVNTMSIHQWKELNVIEGSTCSCFHHTWKPTFHTQRQQRCGEIASWVHVCSLSWEQNKKWIPMGWMGCVFTHRGIFAIEGWGNPSCVQSVVEKIRENNQKVGKIGRIIS